jgi:aspartokinase/homoserine dehydrogenase 1
MSKIIKFGGKSLSNGTGIENVLSIIQSKLKNREKIVVTLSARGNATDELEHILELAKNGEPYKANLDQFKLYQIEPLLSTNFDSIDIGFKKEFELLDNLIEGVRLVKDYSLKTKDLILAQGEILAVKTVSSLLNLTDVISIPVDSRQLFVTNDYFGNAKIDEHISSLRTKDYFNTLPINTIPIFTGFIASNKKGETTTLGRNGTNYSASLLAKFLSVKTVESFTHVNGIFTANPELVDNAQVIEHLSYSDANELASFGASILHGKTIAPLVDENIELHIKNTFNSNANGTVISKDKRSIGVKSISVQNDIVVVNLEGKGILGKSGIDGRIFSTLQNQNISIGLISQGSSERGIGFVINEAHQAKALEVLHDEFRVDIKEKDVNSIKIIKNVSVITAVGQSVNGFLPAYQSLIKNNINILLINNTLSGNNISLVVEKKDVKKAVNLIHSQIFGVAKNINIAIFGKGTVGGSLIDQIVKSHAQILTRKETNLNIFAIVGSQKVLLNKNGVTTNWRTDFDDNKSTTNDVQAIIDYAQDHHLENLIAIDNTASSEFTKNYIPLIENGFDIVSSNKIANTNSYSDYKLLRSKLKDYKKQYLYETNVGAGLPLIDTIKLLHDSGENITRIKGVFSGSLSFLFNEYSAKYDSFSDILKKAIHSGFTEPDPREDLCGNDVARKLLILARELDLKNELEDISIENLIPEHLQPGDKVNFLVHLEELNPIFDVIKESQKPNHVLRYIGDLHGDLQQDKGILDVKLVSVPKDSSLGSLKGSDSIFEIYTESYGDKPIVIQGAGAGAEVTARGVFGDVLRIAANK